MKVAVRSTMALMRTAGGGPSCLPWWHDIGDGNEVTDKSAEANPTDLVGVRLDNKYEVISEVARGGMGIVYRGIDQSLGRPVAIKVLFKRYNEDTESIERFNAKRSDGDFGPHKHLSRLCHWS